MPQSLLAADSFRLSAIVGDLRGLELHFSLYRGTLIHKCALCLGYYKFLSGEGAAASCHDKGLFAFS